MSPCFLSFLLGGYTVTSQSGSKAGTGTIPTELGKLTSWKYVVFGMSTLSAS